MKTQGARWPREGAGSEAEGAEGRRGNKVADHQAMHPETTGREIHGLWTLRKADRAKRNLAVCF